MKKSIVTALFFMFVIVPTHAAFAGHQNHHHDDPLVQLIEMSLFPHRYLLPLNGWHHVDDHRYPRHHHTEWKRDRGYHHHDYVVERHHDRWRDDGYYRGHGDRRTHHRDGHGGRGWR